MNSLIIFPILTLVVAMISCGESHDAQPSKLKREVDDRPLAANLELVDVTRQVNQLMNERISAARHRVNPEGVSWTREMAELLAVDLWHDLSHQHAGTGIRLFKIRSHRVEVERLTAFETILEQRLDAVPHGMSRIKFSESRYRKNRICFFCAKAPAFYLRSAAEYTIAPVIKVDDTLIGIDKLSHFIDIGYWYFDAHRKGLLNGKADRKNFGRYLEGDDTLPKDGRNRYHQLFMRYNPACRLMGCFGFYGARVSGVISFADMNANEDGFRFYHDLVNDPAEYHFQIRSFPIENWNEQTVPSKFIPGLIVEK